MIFYKVVQYLPFKSLMPGLSPPNPSDAMPMFTYSYINK